MRKAVDGLLTTKRLVLGAILLVSVGLPLWVSFIAGDQLKAQLSLLFSDHAFDPMARIACIGAIGAFVGAFLLANKGARRVPVTL